MKHLKSAFKFMAVIIVMIIGSLFGVDFTADYEEEY
jgi:hypothetical protein